jgi:tRNA (guanine37-N1)-methyltransferase
MSMRIDILTLFPEMFAGAFDASIVARALAAGAVELALHNPRDYAADKHRVVDDYLYGGGPGMVMKPEPLFDCIDAVRAMAPSRGRVVLLTPQGRLLTDAIVRDLAGEERLIVICGHYEGVDERVREHLADDEISIGDYVLSGGEPAAIVLVDALVRHVPGALGSEQSLTEESHAQGLLEYPQYTRPPEYRGLAVPDVLLSGHHEEIGRWRRARSIERTAQRRPDMLVRAELTSEERRLIEEQAAGGAAPAHLFRVITPVPDIEQGAAFYAALFGVPGDRVAPNRHYFRCGGTILALVDPSGHDVAFRPNIEHVYFAVPDLRQRYGLARNAGCSWLEPKITRRPWGEKSFYARDPFGNPICFVDEKTVYTGGAMPEGARD